VFVYANALALFELPCSICPARPLSSFGLRRLAAGATAARKGILKIRKPANPRKHASAVQQKSRAKPLLLCLASAGVLTYHQ
jgi:hypothetical protein